MTRWSAHRNDLSSHRELHMHLQRQFNGILTRLKQEIEECDITKESDPQLFTAIEQLKIDLKNAYNHYCIPDAKKLTQETETFREKCQAAVIECEGLIAISKHATASSYGETSLIHQALQRSLTAITAAISYAFHPFSGDTLEDQPRL